jgi:hypothetical protein
MSENNSQFQSTATFRVWQCSAKSDSNSSAARRKAEELHTERAVSEVTL